MAPRSIGSQSDDVTHQWALPIIHIARIIIDCTDRHFMAFEPSIPSDAKRIGAYDLP